LGRARRRIVVWKGLAEVIDSRARVDEVDQDLWVMIVDSDLVSVKNRSNYFSVPLGYDWNLGVSDLLENLLMSFRESAGLDCWV